VPEFLHPESHWPPMPDRLRALAEPARRHRIINEVPDDGGLFAKVVLANLGRIWPVDG